MKCVKERFEGSERTKNEANAREMAVREKYKAKQVEGGRRRERGKESDGGGGRDAERERKSEKDIQRNTYRERHGMVWKD